MDVKKYSWVLTLIAALVWVVAYVVVGHRLIFIVLGISFLLAALGQWVRGHPRH